MDDVTCLSIAGAQSRPPPESGTGSGIGAAAWAALGVGLAITVVLGLSSDGVHHDDDLAHFLMARWASSFPAYLLHTWGRPGLTVPLAALAWIGGIDVAWHVCRAMSAVVTAAGALLAARLGARLKLRPWLVVLACYTQPFNSLLAATTLTENFAALYLIASAYLLMRERPIASALVFSVALVTRYELGVLLPIWWIAIHLAGGRRRKVAIGATLWAPVIYNALFTIFFGRFPAAILLTPSGSTRYLPQEPLAYLVRALQAVSPTVAGAAAIGGIVLWGRGHRLSPAVVGLFFLTHSAIAAVGVYASGAFARFMVTVAPLIGVMAAAGIETLVGSWRKERMVWFGMACVWGLGAVGVCLEMRAGRIGVLGTKSGLSVLWTGAAIAILLVFAGLVREKRIRATIASLAVTALIAAWAVQFALIVRPLRPGADARLVQSAIAWIQARGSGDRPIFAADPWAAYFAGWMEDPTVHKGPRLLAAMPAGTIVLWDSHYCESDFHRVRIAEVESNPAYRRLVEMDGDRGFRVVVFEKMRVTPPLSSDPPVYPPDPMSRDGDTRSAYYTRSLN